jgi:hypothetical protein
MISRLFLLLQLLARFYAAMALLGLCTSAAHRGV